MGMFGAIPSGVFGMPGYGMDQQQMPQQPMPQQPPQMQPQGPQPMAQPGMFGRQPTGFNKPGGWAERLGALGGVFLNAGGVRNDSFDQFRQLQQQRQEDQRKAQLAEAARYAPQEVGGNIVQLNPQTGQYETRYSAPAKPPELPSVLRLQEIADDPNQPASYRATARAAIEAQTNPVITMPGGGMGLRSYVTGSMGGGAPQAYDDLPPGYNIRAPGGVAPAPLTPSGAAPILRGAVSSTTITRAQAAQIRATLGPKGQAAFAQWLAAHNVTVGDQ